MRGLNRPTESLHFNLCFNVHFDTVIKRVRRCFVECHSGLRLLAERRGYRVSAGRIVQVWANVPPMLIAAIVAC